MKPSDPTEHARFYGSATVGSKGQVVVPAEARKELGLQEGDKVVIVRAPLGEGIMLIKAELFEAMINKMQSHLTSVAGLLKNTEDKQ
ncbi:MAG TPA: AbrB/MazE/SpoVT family DNA-binding domain-containing protein [Candidatus Saccharimonadales bacterium]|nr:AbrB/MazE/SpoVT family DNA-binding domain-containing protein [Candidatus Saccharimonadales bacterium]